MAAHLPASNKYQPSSAYRLLFVFCCLTNIKSRQAAPWLIACFSLLILGFAPRPVYVRFVLHEVALLSLFSGYCGFSLSVLVLPKSIFTYIISDGWSLAAIRSYSFTNT